jgi:hypothetical protein
MGKKVSRTLAAMLFVGLVAAVGAGMASVVINEVKLNPSDNLSIWVELYNSGSENVSIGGWTIALVDGAWQGKIAIPEGTAIVAGSFPVFEGMKTWGGRENASVKLIDEKGSIVDETPLLFDKGIRDFTTGRIRDGEDTNTDADWALMQATKGRSNNAGVA